MKILPIQNQKMQNQNNRPVMFCGLKSVVAGRSMREDNQFIALALRLTKRDLSDFKPILEAFPNQKLENDVLHISVMGFDGNYDSPYDISINHIDTFGTDKLTTKFTIKIKALLDRIYRSKKIDTPVKGSDEADKMIKALMGDFNLDEISIDKYGIKSVAEDLEELMPATGEETSYIYPYNF